MFSKKKKGFSALLNNTIGMMILVILIVSVILPAVVTAINETTATGTVATIQGMIPLMIAVGGLITAVSYINPQ